MTAEVPGAEWAPIAGKGGQGYKTTAKPKIVLHTTETNGAGGGGWPNYSSPPHLTLHPDTGELRQHVTLELGAYSLRSPGRPTSPNADAGPVIQIEIIAYAADSPHWEPERYETVAKLVGWLALEFDVPVAFPPWEWVGSEGYGSSSPTRWQSFDAFREFTGICAHQNVWYSSHWDCGALSQDKLEAALLGVILPEPPVSPAPDVGTATWPLRALDVTWRPHDVRYAKRLCKPFAPWVDPSDPTWPQLGQYLAVRFPNGNPEVLGGDQAGLMVTDLAKWFGKDQWPANVPRES